MKGCLRTLFKDQAKRSSIERVNQEIKLPVVFKILQKGYCRNDVDFEGQPNFSYSLGSSSSDDDSDRDDTRVRAIRSHKRELREGSVVGPTRQMDELDGMISPTCPFGELERQMGELDIVVGPTRPFDENIFCGLFDIDSVVTDFDPNNFQRYNEAALAKLSWRILENPKSLLSITLKGKYFPEGDILSFEAVFAISHGWRSALVGRDLLIQNLGWSKSIIHLLFHCPFAQHVWRDAPLALGLI
uniref:Reverse transcriptase zinc-binding domain-containing protein n=1 Tax=Brassica oleracea TaxID=3712 RepID=A0A3P6G4Z1_BRAOL|nr:unnamed protein product [Brassica oleracea]